MVQAVVTLWVIGKGPIWPVINNSPPHTGPSGVFSLWRVAGLRVSSFRDNLPSTSPRIHTSSHCELEARHQGCALQVQAGTLHLCTRHSLHTPHTPQLPTGSYGKGILPASETLEDHSTEPSPESATDCHLQDFGHICVPPLHSFTFSLFFNEITQSRGSKGKRRLKGRWRELCHAWPSTINIHTTPTQGCLLGCHDSLFTEV